MCCNPCATNTAPADETLPSVDVVTAANRPEGVALLDVREQAEWSSGHAPGAIHQRLGAIDPDTLRCYEQVYVMCRSGNRSATATRRLREAGIDAHNITGGIIAWAEARLPADFS